MDSPRHPLGDRERIPRSRIDSRLPAGNAGQESAQVRKAAVRRLPAQKSRSAVGGFENPFRGIFAGARQKRTMLR